MKVFYGWINVGVLLLVYMLLMMPVLLTFGVVLTPMTEALQINATTASLAYSIMSLLSGLCAVAAGMFAKKNWQQAGNSFGVRSCCHGRFCDVLFLQQHRRTVSLLYRIF